MVGLVIVSHSPRLAQGVAELAREMGGHEVRIETAAGVAEGALGTDAVLVREAIERAWSDDGVLVLMDIGSAVLSAEMALELVAEDRRANVLLCEAPIVEGAVAAAVTARLGSSLAQVAEEARKGLAGKAAHLGVVETQGEEVATPGGPGSAERSIRVRVNAPHGLHARPAARLVQTAASFDARIRLRNVTSGRGPVDARSLSAVAGLTARTGHVLEVLASGLEAEAALTAIDELAVDRFGDRAAVVGTEVSPPTPLGPATAGEFRGVTASPGIGIGPARRLARPDLDVRDVRARDVDAELRALDTALATVRGELVAQRDGLVTRGRQDEAAIFDAHLLFLEDAAIVEPAREAVRSGASAPAAWRDALGASVMQWSSLDDPYLRVRADDLRSVGGQVLARLLGVELAAPRLEAPGIVVATNLTPAEAVALGPEVQGVAMANGAPTSHAMIVARSLGIPAVSGLGAGILDVAEGTLLALDGTEGLVQVDPPPEVLSRFETARAATESSKRVALAAAHEPAVTTDGRHVEVMANIAHVEEVAEAISAGADGIGLFRSEFLFMDRDSLPGADEQEEAFRRAAEALEGKPLTVRTLDVGADKPLPALGLEPVENPALGLRGVRLGLAMPDLLEGQLLALLRVGRDHPLRVMFPMVTTVGEVRAVREILDRVRTRASEEGDAVAGSIEVGIMVEVPAAALAAEHLAAEVDFFSIGTNDLAQYTLAADRGDPAVAGLIDPLHPAVLLLIERTAAAAAARRRAVAICGELAADRDAVPLLLGLGVGELSVSAPALPFVKAAVRRTDTRAAEELARQALAAPDAAAVRSLLTEPPGAG
jgi:multiphosphoryl transfer protein